MFDDVMKIGESLLDYEAKLAEVANGVEEARNRVDKVATALATDYTYEGKGLDEFCLFLNQLYTQLDALQRQYQVASIYARKTYDTMNETDQGMAVSMQNKE